jgi:hypothetical protein
MRTVLALLAAVPLLLPPGTCACQIAPRPAPPAKPAAQRPASCRCCAHSPGDDTERPTQNRPADRVAPSQSPDCHCVSTAPHTKPAESPLGAADLVVTEPAAGASPTPAAAAVVPHAPASGEVGHAPLYVSHCALLI